jgi:hypothetical protein
LTELRDAVHTHAFVVGLAAQSDLAWYRNVHLMASRREEAPQLLGLPMCTADERGIVITRQEDPHGR